jgi:GcrA cell cycle regulator
MSWTDDRVETLKKMWGEGQSASQIAKELGGVTRNAVIGKVHRLGLSNRATGGTSAKTEAKAKPSVPKVEPKAKPVVAEKPEKPEKPEMLTQAAAPPRSNLPARNKIIPAGQPLPPQPSANEISPEALAKVNEVEKKAK